MPINPQICEKFDPLAVPTLSKLSAELNVYDAKNQDDSDRKIPGKTTTATIIIHIRNFLLCLTDRLFIISFLCWWDI